MRDVQRRMQEQHCRELDGRQLVVDFLRGQLAAAQAQVQSLQQQLAEVQSESRQ
jgi:hypothetical protein